MTVDLFAGIPVSDYRSALNWYERFFGAPPSFHPNDMEAVWEIGEHRYVYIEHLPDRAGHAKHLLFVPDYSRRLHDLAARGLSPADVETYADDVHKAMFRDTDGNEISIGGTPSR